MKNIELESTIDRYFEDKIIPGLSDFIRIPAVSPNFDKDWRENGNLEQAAELLMSWVNKENIPNTQVDVLTISGKTPVLTVDIAGEKDETMMFYGHMDKMPPLSDWDDGLGPWNPVIKNDRIYGRGSVDNGYALFSIIGAVKALKDQGIPHGRIFILLEATEESGSFDLPAYLDLITKKLDKVNLLVCLDTSAHDYHHVWCTTSLRGVVAFNLSIKYLRKPVHSGIAGGMVPDISRIMRLILSEFEDEKTGKILIDGFNVEIPESRKQEIKSAAEVMRDDLYDEIPLLANSKAVSDDVGELLLARTWTPSMTLSGMEGFTKIHEAGNVARPDITLHLSFRTPPSANINQCIKAIEDKIKSLSLFGAEIDYEMKSLVAGWNGPEFDKWLFDAIDQASEDYFGNKAVWLGEGGGIGFVNMMAERFPDAKFFITGLIGPDSNCHSQNESIYIPAAKKMTCCVAHIIAEHYKNS